MRVQLIHKIFEANYSRVKIMIKNLFQNKVIAFLILLQRTGLQKPRNRLLAKIDFKYFRGILILPSILIQSFNSESVFRNYLQSVHPESNLLVEQIRLAPKNRVLDIGCGIAGYHRLWIDNFSSEPKQLYLLDSTNFNLQSLLYGYGKTDRFYNSLKLAKIFIMKDQANLNIDKQIEILEIEENLRLPENLGLVCSFVSWGFHFPLSIYWDEVLRNLVKGGRLIVDVRTNSNEYTFLKENKHFEIVREIKFGGTTRFVLVKV